MNEKDIYTKQTFGQNIGLGEKPALLMVDFVNGFVDPEILGGGNIAEAVQATVPLLALCRSRRLPIIFTRIVYAADGSDVGLWCEKVPRLRDLTEDAHAGQVVDALAPQAGETIIRKTQASAFFGTSLAAILTYLGRDSLIITGCTTSGCIRASVIDAMSSNFRSVVVRDCVGDRALGPHEANLFDIGQKYADLLTTHEVMALLDTRIHA